MSNITWSAVQIIKTQEDVYNEIEYYKSKTYLDSTDWYVIRFIETGKPIPDNISKERASARGVILKYNEAKNG